MAYEGSDVDTRRHGLDCLAIAGEAVIGEVSHLAEQVERFADTVVKTQRCCGNAAVSDDHSGDALTDLGRHVRLGYAYQVIMGMNVDEARRHRQTRDVDYLIRRDVRQVADCDDRVATDGNIGCECRPAEAINDHSAFQYEFGAEN